MSDPLNKQTNSCLVDPETVGAYKPQSTSAFEPAYVYVGLTTSELAPSLRFLRDTKGRDIDD